jgi:predicted secreted Zn-dependent protease
MDQSHDALRWRKSRASESGNCVEVAKGGATIFVRDSKFAPTGPALSFTAGEWNAFLAGVEAGEFSLPALES